MVTIQAHGFSACVPLVILHVVDPLSYFSFQPVLHDWYNKGRGMCYPVCGMMHIKEPLLLIRKSSLCGSSGSPFSLSEWSLTICQTPYKRKCLLIESNSHQLHFVQPVLNTFLCIIIVCCQVSRCTWFLY